MTKFYASWNDGVYIAWMKKSKASKYQKINGNNVKYTGHFIRYTLLVLGPLALILS